LPPKLVGRFDGCQARGHSRVESEVEIKEVGAGIRFPYARLAIQVVRRRPPTGSTTWSSETVDAISNLPWRQSAST
jgi:hypothetical protein